MRPVRTGNTLHRTAILAIILLTLALLAGALAVGARPAGAQPVPGKDAPLPGQPDEPLAPAGNAFTYQGRLTQSGSPANGLFDLQFSLYDAAAGGSQVGPTQTVLSQTVVDGLFTVPLDFGSSAFRGDARWLQIAVRAAGGGAYNPLSPRQALTAAPYAVGLVPGAEISGTLGASALAASNYGAGDGLSGYSTLGTGVMGTSNSNTGVTGLSGTSYGVYGSSGNIGVYGYSSGANAGVQGQNSGTGYGVYGQNNSSTRSAVYAINTSSGDGVEGRSTSGNGVYGTTGSSSAAIYGNNTGNGVGVYGLSSTGPGLYGFSSAYRGVDADSITGYGVYAESGSTSASAVYGNNTSSGSGVWGNSNSGYGGRFDSDSGTGVYATGGNALYGDASATNGTGLWGVANFGASARGVYGSSSTGTGVAGRSTATNGRGVYGEANTGTGAEGVYGTSTSGQGVYGHSGGTGIGVYAYSASGIGLYAVSGGGLNIALQAYSNSHHAIRGDSNSAAHAAIYGYSTQAEGVFGRGDTGVGGVSAEATGVGVSGRADGADAAGLYGWSDHGSGLYAFTSDGTAIYGVQGTTGPGIYAGQFFGNVRVTGSLSKGGGSFKIDHPLDPENKYLYHSFVESPDMMNIYNGNVSLDAKGEAVVTMPEWFGALNMEFRYQLTPIGGFAPLFVAEEMQANRFKIAGGTAGMKVSWQVTGIRKDPYAEKNRIPVEELKPDEERGKYLHPVEYGQPESKGVDYERLTQGRQRRPAIEQSGDNP